MSDSMVNRLGSSLGRSNDGAQIHIKTVKAKCPVCNEVLTSETMGMTQEYLMDFHFFEQENNGTPNCRIKYEQIQKAKSLGNELFTCTECGNMMVGYYQFICHLATHKMTFADYEKKLEHTTNIQ